MTTSIEKLGFGKWFRDHIDPADLDRFDIARVMAVHKESYIINNGQDDVFAELIGRLVFSAACPAD
jgi:ribosome biogenesis GTPase